VEEVKPVAFVALLVVAGPCVGQPLDLAKHEAVLERFRDCSASLSFDSKNGLLSARGWQIAVPREAVARSRDGYARITVRGNLHGLAVEWLLVPLAPSPQGSQQNSLGLATTLDNAKAVLERAWNASFERGTPDGPDPHPNEVAYFSVPPQWRPHLHAESATATTTSLNCAYRVFTSSRR
jgi:hypothetical protein